MVLAISEGIDARPTREMRPSTLLLFVGGLVASTAAFATPSSFARVSRTTHGHASSVAVATTSAHGHALSVAVTTANRRSQPQMVLATISSSITTILYGAMLYVAGNGLLSKFPKLIAGQMSGAQAGDVAIDAVLFCIAAVQLAKIAVSARRLEIVPSNPHAS